MISFRYHLVSVAAVLLALAAGVALGSGFLSDSVATSSGEREGVDEALREFETGYAEQTSPGLIEGELGERSVVVLTVPGARAEEIEGVTRNLERAGATVTGQVELTGKLIDPANRQFAESVAQESASDVDAVGEAGDAYSRVGAALGRALLGDEGELDDQAQTIKAAFAEGELLSWVDEPSQRADLAVVVAGPGRAGESGQSLSGLLTAVDSVGSGALVAGPSQASQDGGLIAEIRDSETAASVSTVDVTDTAAGQAVAALALARAAAGEDGAWGTSRSADGALPN
ncbi:copper transporter [Aeromicrobium sp. CTD01-1L150]|uniref:copper transporter n=1 Tax=Aeromicrobium sp. CTD01-1L150 TaxID=3341830 RepID=UPI0035BEC0E0